MFTPEKLKKMSDETRQLEIDEAVRDGSHVPYHGPGPEEFENLPGTKCKKAFAIANAPKSKISAATEKRVSVSRYVEAERRLEDLNDRGPRRPGSKLII